MINVLLASSDKAHFSDMINAFQDHGIRIDPVQTGDLALTMVADSRYNMLITDEDLPDMSAKTLIERTITLNPFMNCVVASTLSSNDFHEAFEGLGVLMQFPRTPGRTDVQKLIDHLNKIESLSKK
ncbi:MAG: hypothetical protein H8D87_14075 [Deltaproteobacteria bacterium]|uniref:hypothetical protein n=1 Tax=Desulfobacula sp. TaxID=2593537 RepID=UPI0019A5ABEB|nr:hypothetical protein [Candidatus Desulfobacula maris]MBL6993684.1 hypothetical protein [Desulfobacula sp.]